MVEWAVQVLGDTNLIERLASAIADFAEIRHEEDRRFLVHSGWQNTANWEDVEAAGRSFLTEVNGLLRLRSPVLDPLRFGGVVRLKAGGGHDFFEAGTVTARVILTAQEEVIGAGGKRIAPPLDPLGAWLTRILEDSKLQEALRVYARATDWVDLYKVYELARTGLGGQAAVDAIVSRSTRSRFTETANHHRHADKPLPDGPMSFDHSERLVARLLEEWLK